MQYDESHRLRQCVEPFWFFSTCVNSRVRFRLVELEVHTTIGVVISLREGPAPKSAVTYNNLGIRIL